MLDVEVVGQEVMKLKSEVRKKASRSTVKSFFYREGTKLPLDSAPRLSDTHHCGPFNPEHLDDRSMTLWDRF